MEPQERVGNKAKSRGIPEPDSGPYLEIPIIPEELEAIAVREGYHERIQAEIQHEDKQVEVMAEEMLDPPQAWNEVPYLMMETEDGRMIPDTATKQKRYEVARGQRKQWKEDKIRQEKCEHSPRLHSGHELPQDSIQKSGTSHNRRRMTGRCLINGREYLSWCFMADIWKYILLVQNVYQDPVLNTKEADVAHGKVKEFRRV